MNNGLLDSSVLIDCLRGHAGAVAFLASQAPPATTHIMVAAELLAGARSLREQQLIESFLNSFQIASPNEADGVAAFNLYRQHRLSQGVDWPDCQIAATAIRLGVEFLL